MDDPGGEQDDPDNEEDHEVSPVDVSLSGSDDSSNEEDDDIPAITHSVVFKCIGCTKELRYQELLALASQKIKKEKQFL